MTFSDAGCKTYKADYVKSQCGKKLLGITVEQIQKGYLCFGENCIPKILEDPKKNYLKEIQANEQQGMGFSIYVLPENRGTTLVSYIIAMGSEVNGKEIYPGYV